MHKMFFFYYSLGTDLDKVKRFYLKEVENYNIKRLFNLLLLKNFEFMAGVLMNITDMQNEVDQWITQFEEEYWHPLVLLARLTEEVGELAREVNHRFGQKTKKSDEKEKDLALEIADIIFVLLCLANSQGINVEKAFQATMEKYRLRDGNRWTLKETKKGQAGGNN